MRTLKVRQCKICRNPYTPHNSLQAVCYTVECAKAQAQKSAAKKARKAELAWDKQRIADKRAYKLGDWRTREKAAREACHKFIKLRDQYTPCICCGKPMTGQVHAGHFWESGNFSFIRYHEDNIHAQSAHCNTYKGGDSG